MDFTAQVKPLARRFSDFLILDLGRETVRQVIDRNTERGQFCASHDFCDANMVMHRAVEDLKIITKPDGTFDEERWFQMIGDGCQAEIELWNNAWNMAIENKFWIDEARWFDED